MLKDFNTSENRLSIEESKIYEARLTGLSLSQLADLEVEEFITSIIFKTAAISGIRLPTNEVYIEELEKEVKNLFLSSMYGDFTKEEIVLALRINIPAPYAVFRFPTGADIERVEPFGDSVSVEYLAMILRNYRTIRETMNRKMKNYIDGNGYNY